MNKKILLLMSILLLISVACSFSGAKNNSEPVVVIQTVVVTEAAAVPAPTDPPAVEEAVEVPTVEEPAAEEQTTSGNAYYTDSFDGDTSSWYTWVSAGDASRNYSQTKPGTIVMSLPSQETYAYFANEDYEYDDVYVEAEMAATVYGDNGLAVLCRISEDGWYEVRFHTTGQYAGSFQMYRYDQILKDEGKNPYVNIMNGLERVNTVNILNGNKTNIVGLRCVGENITPIINGVAQTLPKEVPIKDDYLTSGQIGVGAMSFSNGKVEVEIDSVTVQQP
jgi:hypothetical protein